MIDCDVQGIKVERGQTAGWRRGGGAAARPENFQIPKRRMRGKEHIVSNE
jgi:hypothetical protein